MKKFFKGLGIFSSIILTIVLSVLIFLYVIILNIKFMISENGMSNALKKIDVVETLKTIENGVIWEDFKELSQNLNLNEEQFEELLNSDKVKEEIGSYISVIINSIFDEKETNITKEDIEDLFNIAIDEYNKVSDTKISKSERQDLLNSIDEETIENINKELSSIDITDEVPHKYEIYIELIENVFFGTYSLMILISIIFIISLIALFTFSCYKWISYVKTSTIIIGSIMLSIGLVLLFIPLKDMEIIELIKSMIITKIFITAAILFIISILLSIGKKYLKKYIESKKNTINIETIN